MSNEEFKLPVSSLEELEKIIQAYSQKSGKVSNVDLEGVTGIGKTTISGNNKFLLSLELVEGGNKKEVTALGKKLGHAIHHKQDDDIRKYWREVISNNSFLSEQLTAVRVQKGIKPEDFPSKILYNSRTSKNKHSEVGARTVSDIFLRAGLIEEVEGKYQVVVASEVDNPPNEDIHIDAEDRKSKEPPESGKTNSSSDIPIQFAVNLQIQIPEFEDTEKYKELFAALRKHLLNLPVN